MKIKCFSSFIALFFFVCVFAAWAQVTDLVVAPVGNQVILCWPATATGSILQNTTNLASPNWEAVSNAVSLNAVSVTNSTPSMFFRLFSDGMRLIPAGWFTMGDTLDGETDAIPTNVYVSAFYMDATLVTYSQWQAVYNWATNGGYGFDYIGYGKATNHPVQGVDWFDVVKWCNARSQQAGLTPVYYTDATLAQVYTNGDLTPFVKWTAKGYRLPTEAEWEKAARGGLIGQRFPWGNAISESLANYYGATNTYSYDSGPSGYNTNFDTGEFPYTSPVDYFPSNGYGLNDMAGNVEVWCWDWYGTPYGQPTTNNPTGPASGSAHVLRGDSWSGPAYFARCANRDDTGSYQAGGGLGFRCVRCF